MPTITLDLRFTRGERAILRLDPNNGLRGDISALDGQAVEVKRWSAHEGFNGQPVVSYTVRHPSRPDFRVDADELVPVDA